MGRPEHPNREFEKALNYAESRGWRVVKSGPRAHAWGKLYCPIADRDGCIVGIYSTPRNPEDHARHIIRQIETCPHATETESGT